MKFDKILPFIYFIPVLLIQVVIVPYFELSGIVPDLILILIVFYTLKFGQLYGIILAFILGGITDFSTGSILGSSMFTKTLSAFIAGYFFNENQTVSIIKSPLFLGIIFLSSLVNAISFSLISNFDISLNIFSLIFEEGMIPAIYTTIIASIVMIFFPKRSYI
ncbi:MAG: rod shape-determining protein MreD [Ignavibacteria bacterium]|nr:rod shape-determining protein MreD [Ignavibacteria bacterium]